MNIMNEYKFLINNKMNFTFFIIVGALIISSIIYLTKLNKDPNSGRGSLKSYREYVFIEKDI